MTPWLSLSEFVRRYKKKRRVAVALDELNTRISSGRAPGRPHGLPMPLVISLTSFPARYATLPLVLRSLLAQTLRPDRVILWISGDDHALLTGEILDLVAEGLEIAKCNDLKSYNKIIHTLRATPACFIATADDDVYYWPEWLEGLVSGLDPAGKHVVCHRAHEIAIDGNGVPEPYGRWRKNAPASQPSELVFPTGVLGVLYPPDAFHPDVCEEALFGQLCPTADDIWLYWMFRLNGKTAKKTGIRRHVLEWPGSQKVSLQQQNIIGSGNDVQLRNMVRRYGFPR